MHDIIITRLIESERVLQNQQSFREPDSGLLNALVSRFKRTQTATASTSIQPKSRSQQVHCACAECEPAR